VCHDGEELTFPLFVLVTLVVTSVASGKASVGGGSLEPKGAPKASRQRHRAAPGSRKANQYRALDPVPSHAGPMGF
jgi:hypothetical protein